MSGQHVSDSRITWLLGVIEEDAQTARDAVDLASPQWSLLRTDDVIYEGDGTAWSALERLGYRGQRRARQIGEHITVWDPKRALAECETKQRIVERHHPRREGLRLVCDRCHRDDRVQMFPCPDLVDVASTFADQADYREEDWRS